MSLSQKNLRRGAATSAVVLAFSAMAPAFADDAGLINDSKAVIRYGVTLSETMAAVAGDDLARGRAGGFMVHLEAKLRAPLDRPQMVTYPQEFTRSMLVMGGVVPPASQYATAGIPVCAQQSGKILYKGHVSPKGEVIQDSSAVPPATEDPDRPCRAWLISEGKAMMQRSAQQQAEQKAVSKPSASLATATPNG